MSPFRLDPVRDSGYTVGDKNGTRTYCLYFARGCCVLGSECEYLHHLPCQDVERLKSAESSLSSSIHSDSRSRAYDCFGREKFAEYREDMGGVGSFQRENRSLYVGGLNGALPRSLSTINDNDNNNNTSHGTANVDSSKIEGRLRYLFSKFGELDRIRYVASKSCAFVKYRHVSDAEFAREATMNQTLLLPSDPDWESADRTERTGLLVKWANEDPDPGAKRRKEEEDKRRTRELIKRLLLSEGKNSKADMPIEMHTTHDSPPSSSRLLDLWLHRHGGNNDGIRKRLIGQRSTPEQFLQQYLESEKQKPRMTGPSNTTTTISNTVNGHWRRTLNDFYSSSDDDDDDD